MEISLLPTLIFLSCFLTAGLSAPLFPDVRDSHWAKDAVAALAAKGLVEGYPDGTFKGDRAMTRWETAQVVARLLSKMETAHATFATRAETQELRKLVDALAEELEALGVRTTALEEDSDRLDRRVTELERITFYGSIDARVVSSSFKNEGISDNDSLRNGGGLPGGLPYVNYDQQVGSFVPGLIRPQVHGVLPVVDYLRGRVLSNGTGFTARGVLGVNVDVSDDLKAGLELVGFSSQGDFFLDGYWGLNAPYAAHAGSTNPGDVAQPLSHTPFTRMVMDKFWLKHEPTSTQLSIGSLNDLNITPLIYMGQNNTSVDGPRRLNFGFALQGKIQLADDQELRWEAFKSRIGSRNFFQGQNYDHSVYGGDIRYSFHNKAGWVQLDYARIYDEAIGGNVLNVGLLGFNNVAYGASGGWTAFQWVNPPGHFANQRSAFEQANSGGALVGINTVDTRPISGWNGNLDNAVGVPAGAGNYGPQSQITYGVEMGHRWNLNEKDEIGFLFNYGRSDYRSNRNSSFTSEGDALKLTVDGSVFQGDLDWNASYLKVDPNYGPTRFRNGLIGARFPTVFQVAGAFHAHDFNTYPHNREGFRAGLKWHFDERRGTIFANGEWLRQTQTSLYDVRVTQNALGAGTPNFPVIGFSPGSVDYVYAGYAHPNLYGLNSGNSFTAQLAPLEDPRGKSRTYRLGGRYKFPNNGLGLKLNYQRVSHDRPSSLTVAQGGSQNEVDIDVDTIYADMSYEFNPKHKVTLGADIIKVTGHHDPAGLYNAYAQSINSTTFDNIDSLQTIPFLSYDHTISDKTNWNFTLRRYDTTDNIGSEVRAGRALDTIGSSVHPFEWSGFQLTTTFSMSF